MDDSPTIRKVVELTLRREGLKVVTAGDGLTALAAVMDSEPDLILLDVVLPQMDGYQICQAIKRHALGRNIPVIMLTGRDGIFDRVRGRWSGSAAYLTKPFDPDQLLQTVRKYLRRS